MKLKSLKVANAVTVSREAHNFFESSKFDMTLTQGVIVTIKAKRDGDLKCTSLFNVIEWVPEAAASDEKPLKPVKLTEKASA